MSRLCWNRLLKYGQLQIRSRSRGGGPTVRTPSDFRSSVVDTASCWLLEKGGLLGAQQ